MRPVGRRVLGLVPVMLLVLPMMSVFVAPARADDNPDKKSEAKTLHRITSAVPSAYESDLALGVAPELAGKPRNTQGGGAVPAFGSGPDNIGNTQDAQICPPNGDFGDIEAELSATADWEFGFYVHVYFSGNSNVLWLGDTPFNADSVENDNSWSADGFNIDVSLPGGIDAGWSGGGGDASFDYQVDNDWEAYTEFYNLHFHGTSIWDVDESDCGQFGFDYAGYQVCTDDTSSRF